MPGTIVSTRELARTFENEIGTSGGTAKRRFVSNLSDDTLINGGPPDIASIFTATVGTTNWWAVHPVHTALRHRKMIVNERFEDDPYKIEVIAEYGLVTPNELLTPTARTPVWSFEGQSGEVPALFYYDGALQYPLTNSAYDFFPGLTTDESMVRIKVQQNFGSYPNLWLAAQNHLNDALFIGCAQDTVKVVSVESQYTIEEWNNQTVAFYASTANLLYRQSSHILLLPDVGYNFIDAGTGQRRRGMTFDFQNGEWVPSPNPIALNGAGGQVLNGQPAILPRRVNPRANFTFLFGSPSAGGVL